MKKIIIVFLAIISMNSFAQTEISSTINSVKVYRQNAEITREVFVNITPGTKEIVLTGISLKIIPSSIQIILNSSNCDLLSVKYERDYLKPKKNNPEIEKLVSKLNDLDYKIIWIRDQLGILKGMEDILNTNKDLGGNNTGFTPAQVIELSNTYKTKYLEIKKEQASLNKEFHKLTKEKKQIQMQLNELKATINNPTANIVLTVASKKSDREKITCKYNVSDAGWSPIYDLRSKGIDDNVILNYKANVYQNTGYNWKNVDITISTGNPLQDNNRPILHPLYANINRKVRGSRRASTQGLNSGSENNMAYYKGKHEADYYNNSLVISKNMNIEFKVLNKQSINSDMKLNLMPLKTFELSTDYIYHSVPKLNKGAFLLAKVSDWGQYNLITGEANIFFEDAFVGKTTINPNVTADTLLISMGRDNSITIERKSITKYTSTNLIGKNKEVKYGYEITILNKKSVPINIEILDQIPVSQDELIKVNLEEKGSAKYNAEIGKLLWKININPSQSKKERFIYSVKYPKKMKVTGLI